MTDLTVPSTVAVSGIAIEFFGVPSAALVGAAMGSAIALFISEPIEPRSKMWLAVIANFAAGVYGGQLTVKFYPDLPIIPVCAILGAIGIKLIPSVLEFLKGKLGGKNANS